MQAKSILVAQQIGQRTIPSLERQVDDMVATKPPHVDLVMSQVQMIDSVGLNWLLSVQARLETLGTKLRVVDPSQIVADILLATRLEGRLSVTHSSEMVQGVVHGRH